MYGEAITFQALVYTCIGVLFALTLLCVVLICLLISNVNKTKLIKQQLDELAEDKPLAEVLVKTIEKQEEAMDKTDDLTQKIDVLSCGMRKTFDKIAVVRYSAISDNVSEPSFSVGITNSDDDGILITGIQDVGGTRVTVKTVNGGKCSEKLTREEKKALER